MRRTALLAVAATMILACAPENGGGTAGSRPTKGPQIPRQPAQVNYHLGVSLKDNQGNVLKNRIHVIVDAVDAKGGRGTAAEHVPLDREVASGWEFTVGILPSQKEPVHMKISGTVTNLPVGTLVSCWIRTDDYSYLADNWARVTPERPGKSITANCVATVTGVGK